MYWMEGRYEWPTAFARGEDLPKEQKEQILLTDISEEYYGAVTDLEAFCKNGVIYNENTYYELSEKEQKVSILEDTNVLLAVLCTASALLVLADLFCCTEQTGGRVSDAQSDRSGSKTASGDDSEGRSNLLGQFPSGRKYFGVAGTYLFLWWIREKLHFELIFSVDPGQILIGILSVSVAVWLGIGGAVLRMQRGKQAENGSEQKRLDMIGENSEASEKGKCGTGNMRCTHFFGFVRLSAPFCVWG